MLARRAAYINSDIHLVQGTLTYYSMDQDLVQDWVENFWEGAMTVVESKARFLDAPKLL